MAVVDAGETIQLFARAKGPVVDTRKAQVLRRRVVDESDGEDEIERRARDMAVDPVLIQSQAPMLQVEHQAIVREQVEAAKKEKAAATKPAPKAKAKGDGETKKVLPKVSDDGDGPVKKRKLGKKEREKKARAEAAAEAATATAATPSAE
jgi:hypothetical protein|tara:strand:- start:345 stop:794 length:450 start_codon:yes stop_codon:yes gene_type:complete|mmetsp:Transcript_5175/g.19374  ORF Transcript_5175/g.19374 Transcript_5175/m.19374 type:complete len:150 (-) Transcript_5175:100-549(-)